MCWCGKTGVLFIILTAEGNKLFFCPEVSVQMDHIVLPEKHPKEEMIRVGGVSHELN